MLTSRRALLAGMLALALTGVVHAAPRGPRGPRVAKAPRTPNIPAAAMQSRAVQASVKNGGHLYKHVAQSKAYMQGRVASTNAKLTFNAAAAGADLRSGKAVQPQAGSSRLARAVTKLANYRASPRQFSSFSSARATDAAYSQALRSNRTKIAAWMKSPEKTLPVSFDAGPGVGTVFSQPAGTKGRFTPATSGQFVLQKQGPNAFYPKTAQLK